MNNFQSHFHFSKQQKSGLVLLLLLIISLQLFLFYGDFNQSTIETKSEKEWLALQRKLNILKNNNTKEHYVMLSFNPNFITDYKGYKLGMSVQEIDRLFAFRKQNKYVNSINEFQNVTKVSDSLLQKMAPYFKFPDWIKNKKNTSGFVTYKKKNNTKNLIQVKDINHATAADFITIYGIGEKLSERILTHKENIGGFFVVIDQVSEIWGLSPEVIAELKKHFKIITKPAIKKIPINDASVKELSQFFYFKYALAKQIVIYRSMNGNFNSIEDLAKIKDFPVDKATIINLYLEF